MLTSLRLRTIASKTILATLLLTMLQFVPGVDWLNTSANAGYPNPGPISYSSTDKPELFVPGVYIIDAGAVSSGATKQTIAQGIKPYGLVYALVKAKIPVQWVINPNKDAISQTLGNAGTDFTYDCDGAGSTYAPKNYRTGAFVITKEFAAQAASLVTTWRAKGVVVDGVCTNTLPTLPVFATIKSWPRTALDAQNGAVAVTYFTNAEIPQGSLTDPLNPPAYRFVAPSALTPCDDMYVMPHADPTYATHKNLIDFVKNGGDFYASCHAVSIVENMTDGTNTNKVMNFLSTNGLVNYDSHVQGSPAYTIYDTTTAVPFAYIGSYKSNYTTIGGNNTATDVTGNYTLTGIKPGDPIAQFLGVTDAAQQQGSEQIFMPVANSRWRSTTQVVVYDQTQTNTPNSSAVGFTSATLSSNTSVTTSSGPAASVLYGPAFGNSAYGQVMYVGGHSSNKGTTDDVAAQRLFFNFQLLAAVNASSVPSDTDRTPTVTLSPLAVSSFSPGQQVDVSGVATGGSGSFRYQWSASCFSSTGAALSDSGSFDSTSSSSATFTAPSVVGVSRCNLTLTAIDTCGRYTFGFQSVGVAPKSDIEVTASTSGAAQTASNQTYTFVVKNNGSTRGSADSNIATDVLFTSSLPSTVTIISVSSPTYSGTAPTGAACAKSGLDVSCDLKNMLDEQTATITIVVKPSATGTLEVTGFVSTTATDVDLTNNEATLRTTIGEGTPTPGLTFNKIPEDQQANTNGVAAFKLEVENSSTGGITLNNIALTDTFGTNGSIKCYEGDTLRMSGTSPVTYTIPSLAAGAVWTASCEITGVTATGTNVLSGTTTSQTRAGTTTTISALTVSSNTAHVTVGANSALDITKISSGSIYPGGKITYTVTVTNNTGSTRSGIHLDDLLPVGLTAVAGSASIKSTDTTQTSTDVNNVIAHDKLNYSSTSSMNGGTGWAASSWTIGGDGEKSLSDQILKFNAKDSKTFSAARTVSLSKVNSNVTVLFECSGDSSAPSVRVSLGSKTWADVTTCNSSTRKLIALTATASEIGLTDTAANIELKFYSKAGSSSSSKPLYFDDISVVSNYLAADSTFTSSYSAGSGFASGSAGSSWTEVDTQGKLQAKTDKGYYLRWKDAGSSDIATLSRTVSIPAGTYSSAKLNFSYMHSSITAGNLKVCINDATCTGTAAWSDPGTSAGDTSNYSNMARASVNLPTESAVKITFYFKGSSSIYVDDIAITASPKGSSNVLKSGVNLKEILDGTYSLADKGILTLTFTANIAKPFPVIDAVGIVNVATVSSTGQTTPSAAVAGDGFKKPDLSITKSASATSVVSGNTVTYTYVLKNAGSLSINIASAPTDDACTPLARGLGTTGTLTAGSSWTYTCTSPALTTDVTGTVTISAVDPTDANATLDDSDVLTVNVVDPKILVVSSPGSASIYSGGKVGYTYTVTTGTGNMPLQKVAVTAANCATPAYDSGDLNGDLILQLDESWKFVCTTGAISTAQTNQNVVASGENSFNGATSYDTKTVAVAITDKPVLTIVKEVKDGAGGTYGSSVIVGASNSIIYKYTLTVTGSSLTGLKINDSGCTTSIAGRTGDNGTSGTLEVGETWVVTCTVPYALTLSETTTATAYGTDALGNKIQSNKGETYVDVQIPGIFIAVEPANEYVLVNAPNTYTYKVKNTGGVALSAFNGRDERCATPNIVFGAIAIGETVSTTCTYAHIPEDTLTEFTGTGTYGGGTIVADTATAMVFAINPTFHLVKKATVYVGNSNTVRSAAAQTVTAQIGDRIVFSYELTTETGTGASRIAGLNAIFKSSYSDADCVVGGLTDVDSNSDGYNDGDSNNNGYIDQGEVWVYTCEATSSLTAGLRAAPIQPLAKVRNGGLVALTSAPALMAVPIRPAGAYATTTKNSPATFGAKSPLGSTIIDLSSSSTVVITLEGVTTTPSTPPATPPSPSLLTPTITWPNPPSQVGPYKLTPTELNAVCSVPGSTLTYSPALGTSLNPGTYTLTVTCTPPAGSGYGPLTKTVPFVVTAPPSTITWPTPNPVLGPFSLGPNQLNATCSVPGSTMTYDPAKWTKLNPGTYTLTVTCTPPPGSPYAPSTAKVELIVKAPGGAANNPSTTPTTKPTTPANPSTTELDPPSKPIAKLKSSSTSTIAWVASPNATGYYVTINDKKFCTTAALSCTVKTLVGPASDIKIYATKGKLTSTYVTPKIVKAAKPQVIGMVYFDTARYEIRPDGWKELTRIVNLLKKYGWKNIVINGHTDSRSYDNMTLSNNRAKSTQDGLSKMLPGLKFTLNYSGATEPMATNTTPEGQQANRRAEIAVW